VNLNAVPESQRSKSEFRSRARSGAPMRSFMDKTNLVGFYGLQAPGAPDRGEIAGAS
jgi:hypothetical protein